MNFKKFISGVSAFAIAASAFAGLAVTASAETSDLYVVPTWSAAAAADFDANITYNEADNTVTFNRNDTYTASKSFSTTANSIVTYEVDWIFATATARADNFNWIKFGDKIGFAVNSTYNVHAFVNSDISAGYNGTSNNVAYLKNQTANQHIKIVYDQATNTITTATFDGVEVADLKDKVVADFVPGSISLGFIRGGRVNWTLVNGFGPVSITEEKQTVSTVGYTINYNYNNETIDTFSATGVVGREVSADSPKTIGGTKYYAVDGSTLNMTLAADASSNVLNVNLRQAETYKTSLTSSIDGSELSTANVTEGDSVRLAYPRYQLDNRTLYYADTTDSEYRKLLTPDHNNYSQEVTYTASDISNAVFYAEGENIPGATPTDGGSNIATRCSNAKVGYVAENSVNVVKLPAGVYTICVQVYKNNSGNMDIPFTVGSTPYTVTQVGASNGELHKIENITIAEESDLTLGAFGSSKDGIDFIYVQKVGDLASASAEKLGTTEVQADGTVADMFYGTYTPGVNSVSKIKITVNGQTQEIAVANLSGDGDVSFGVVISYLDGVSKGYAPTFDFE